jgi:hypothetical protein
MRGEIRDASRLCFWKIRDRTPTMTKHNTNKINSDQLNQLANNLDRTDIQVDRNARIESITWCFIEKVRLETPKIVRSLNY